MQINTHKVKWKVSLSNGSTFHENKGDYIEKENELSPWQKLQKYITKNKVKITSLSLYTDNGQTFNLPSTGNNPNFKPFREAEKPLDFDLKRYMGRELDLIPDNKVYKSDPKNMKVELYTVIEAIYQNYILSLWVDENNILNCWSLFSKNERT